MNEFARDMTIKSLIAGTRFSGVTVCSWCCSCSSVSVSSRSGSRTGTGGGALFAFAANKETTGRKQRNKTKSSISNHQDYS